MVQTPGCECRPLAVTDRQLRVTTSQVPQASEGSQENLGRGQCQHGEPQSEDWLNRHQCYPDGYQRRRSHSGRGNCQKRSRAEETGRMFADGTNPSRHRRRRDWPETTQASQRARYWIMTLGSAVECPRNLKRVPKKTVHWADGWTNADDAMPADCHHHDPCTDRPVHSILCSHECTFQFEALANANWMSWLVFKQKTDDELRWYSQTLLSPSDTQSDSDERPAPLHGCSLGYLDDEPCYSVHDRHNLFQLPRYCHILFRLLQEQGQTEHEDEGPTLHVVTWFLHGQQLRIQRRPRQLRLDSWFMNWEEDLRRLWADQMSPDHPFEAFVVHQAMPQHPAFDAHFHLLIVQEQPLGEAATLQVSVFDDGGTPIGLLCRAAFCPMFIGFHDLVDHFEIGLHCQMRDCTFQSDTTFLHSDSLGLMPVRNGICIQNRLGPLERAAMPDNDETVLMQTFANDPLLQDNLRLTQLMPRWEYPIPEQPHEADTDDENDPHDDRDEENDESEALDIDDIVHESDLEAQPRSLLFRLTRHHRRTILSNSLEDPAAVILESAAAWNIDPTRIREQFHIPVQVDHEEAYITELFGDRQPDNTAKLVLIDTIFHYNDPGTAPRQDRRVRLLPTHLGRFRLLFLCHISHHCLLESERCIVRINSELWPLQDVAVRRIRDGDYIRIWVPPSADHEDTSHLAWTRQISVNPALNVDEEIGSPSEDAEEDDADACLLQINKEPLWHWIPHCFQHDDRESSPVDLLTEVVSNIPDGPNFVPPLLPRVLRQDELHRALTPLVDAFFAAAGDSNDEGLYIHTWYIDPLRHPVCLHSRDLRINLHDATDWYHRIAQLWFDHLTFDDDISWYLVNPGPPALAWQSQDPVHIILQQHRLPEEAAVLISVMDNSLPYPAWQNHARSCPTNLRKHWLLHDLQVLQRCIPELSTIQCVLLHNHIELDNNDPYHLEDGIGLRLLLNDAMVRRAHGIFDPAADDATDDVSVMQIRPPQTLQLNDLLPSDPCTRIPCADVEYVREQIRTASLGPVHDFGQTVKWHPATVEALQHMPIWRYEVPVHYAFFTDGTACHTSDQAAGSVVLVVYTLAGPRFGGFRTFLVRDHPTAARAEAGAILFACWWALQLAQTHPGHLAPFDVSFNYDNVVAGNVAAGRWKSSFQTDILVPARALTLWLEALPGSHLEWHYIPSHEGHPYNEAADSACWAAMQGWILSTDIDPLLGLLSLDGTKPYLIEWMWFHENVLQGREGFPLIGNHAYIVNIQQPFQQQPVADDHSFMINVNCRTLIPALEPTRLLFRCATANVLSLYAGTQQHGAFVSSRHEALLRECHAAGIHCVGVQETRSRLEGHTATEEFHVLSSPATTRGVGGIQLWIARVIAYEGMSIHIDASDLRILHATAQRMVVRLSSPHLKLIILVLHAPSSEDDQMLLKWWKATSASIPSEYRTWNWLVLADANARVGSLTSDAISDAGAQDENTAGRYFHEWLTQHGLWLPQTFPAHHHGDVHNTWIHGSGAEARLDYIAVSSNLQDSDTVTQVGEIDLSIKRTDHRMVTMDLPLDVWPCRDRRPHIQAPHERPQVDMAAPVVPWHVDVHTHASCLQRWAADTMPPPPRRRKRKPHLTDSTWQAVLLKKYHYNRIRQVRHAHRIGMLRVLFQAWRNTDYHTGAICPWLRLCDRHVAIHQSRHRALCAEVSASVKRDDASFYDSLAREHGGIAADEGLPKLWKSLRPILPRQAAKRKNNSRCRGPDVQELAEHYCRLECGSAIDYEQLLQQCHDRQHQAQTDAPLAISIEDIPTLQNMEAILISCKKGKAPGLDRVPAEHLRALMAQHGSAFYGLYFKSWMLAAEPLTFKGGFLASIAKKAGVLRAAAMRGIMVLDTTGKVYHALMRAQLMRWAASRRHSSQFGGFKGQQCSFASLLLRGYCNRLDQLGVSCSILFVDVRSAFHCLIRQHLFTGDALPPALRQLLIDEGIDPATLDALAHEHAQFFLSEANPALARAATDAHCNTWYTLPGSGGCFETLRGSRPGSPLADLVYNMMMSSLLKDLQQHLDQNSKIQEAAAYIGHSPPLVTWVDDLAVVIPSIQAEALIDVTSQVATLVQQTFNNYGLSLNYNAGKTEIIVQFRGKGSAALRREHFVESFRSLHLGPDRSIRLVSQYQHLGARFAQNLSVASEVAHRINKATQAFRLMSRGIFLNRYLPVTTRLSLLESLVFPVLLYGAGNWPLLPSRLYSRVQHLMIGWQRRITGDGFWQEAHSSDADFLAQWRMPPLSIRLAKLRILLALQMQQNAPAFLFDVVSADTTKDRSWIRALQHGLTWWCTHSPDHALVSTDLSVADIYTWLGTTSRKDARCLRTTVRRYCEQEYMLWMVRNKHQQIRHLCDAHGVQCDDYIQPSIACDDSHPCTICAMTFTTPQGLSAHLWKAHGQMSLERRYVFGPVCRICNKCYWSSQRMQQHLRYSRRHTQGCLEQLIRHFEPLTEPVEVRVPDTFQDLHRLPWVHAPGPAAPLPQPLYIRKRLAEWQDWHSKWMLLDMPEDLSSDIIAGFHDKFNEVTREWILIDDASDVDQLVYAWLSSIDQTDQPRGALWAFFQWTDEYMYDLFDEVENPDMVVAAEQQILHLMDELPEWRLWRQYSRICSVGEPPPPDLALPARHRDQRCFTDLEPHPNHLGTQVPEIAHILGGPVLEWPVRRGVPLLRGKDGKLYMVILHMFSGRRRENDCHTWLHQLCSAFLPLVTPILLSADTAIDLQDGNLASGPALQTIMRLASAGAITATLAGPPCETWTEARHIEAPPDAMRRFPRPLRSGDLQWGLCGLSMRELQQLTMGSLLMLNSLQIELRVLSAGGANMMEHPDFPADKARACAWRTPLHAHYFGSHPSLQQIRIEQWRYGSAAIKPTQIRITGLPKSAKILHAQGDPSLPRPTTVLSGWDAETKSFKTSIAKEYPGGLCKALITTLLHGLRDRIHREGAHEVDATQLQERDYDWLWRLADSGTRIHRTTHLADYQPV